MEGFGGRSSWSSLRPDPLHALLDHSDSDGEIEAGHCIPLGERLNELVPLLHPIWRETTINFARGMLEAGKANENVGFS
jgi:hypothetical protein